MSTTGDLVRRALETASDSSRLENLILESIPLLQENGAAFRVYKPGVIEFHEATSVSFIGDVHGDFYSLTSILENVVPRITSGGTAVFLGDYIDRGYAQVESIALTLILKNTYPDRVVLLRGNHEPPEWLKPYPHDFPDVLRRMFGDKWVRLYDSFKDLFSKLPLIAFRRNGFLAVHGGPPLKSIRSNSFEEAFEIGLPGFSAETLESVLWSDPTELNVSIIPSPRGAGYLYGFKFTEKALSLINGRFIVRGHEYVNGYKETHEGRVITVFSAPIVYELRYAGLIIYEEGEEGYKLEKILVEPKYAKGV